MAQERPPCAGLLEHRASIDLASRMPELAPLKDLQFIQDHAVILVSMKPHQLNRSLVKMLQSVFEPALRMQGIVTEWALVEAQFAAQPSLFATLETQRMNPDAAYPTNLSYVDLETKPVVFLVFDSSNPLREARNLSSLISVRLLHKLPTVFFAHDDTFNAQNIKMNLAMKLMNQNVGYIDAYDNSFQPPGYDVPPKSEKDLN